MTHILTVAEPFPPYNPPYVRLSGLAAGELSSDPVAQELVRRLDVEIDHGEALLEKARLLTMDELGAVTGWLANLRPTRAVIAAGGAQPGQVSAANTILEGSSGFFKSLRTKRAGIIGAAVLGGLLLGGGVGLFVWRKKS